MRGLLIPVLDLPRTPLPLTSQHRDKIDQTVLERVRSSYLKMIIEDGGANAATIEPLLERVMAGTIEAAVNYSVGTL